MQTIEQVLKFVPANRVNRVTAALTEFEPIIERFVGQVFDKLEKTSNREFITSASDYIKPISKITCYMRYGTERYGRFGHPYLCISNLELPESLLRKGLFSALIYTLFAECEE